MPSGLVRELLISASTRSKISSKHGVDPDQLVAALEGTRLPYRVEADPRGDKWAVRVQLGRKVGIVRLRPLADGRHLVVTAWFE